MKLYATLTKSLLGVYFPLPTEDVLLARKMLNTSSLDKLWCSIYPEKVVAEFIKEYGGVVLPDDYAKRLDFDSIVLQEEIPS